MNRQLEFDHKAKLQYYNFQQRHDLKPVSASAAGKLENANINPNKWDLQRHLW